MDTSDLAKLVLATVVGCMFAAVPMLLSRYRHRTALILYGFMFTITAMPYFIKQHPSFSMFAQNYQLIAGITWGVEFYLMDFFIVAIVVDRLVDRRQSVAWMPRGGWPFVILLVGMGISMIDAFDRILTFSELWKIIKGMILFWAIANLCRTREGLMQVVEVVIVGTATLVFCSVAFHFLGDYRAARNGMIHHKNVWALYLNTFAPITIALCFFNFRLARFRIAFLLGVLGVGLLLKVSESRGGQACFAMAVSMIAGLGLVAQKRAGGFAKGQVVILFACVLAGVVFYFDSIVGRWQQGMQDQVYYAEGAEFMSDRKEMRDEAEELFHEFPTNGIGLNNYSYYWWYVQPNIRRTVPHSLYYSTAAETGLIGLGALLLFMSYWVVLGLRTAFMPNSPPLKALAIAMPAVFLVPMVHCLIEYNFRNYICYIAYCLMAGIASGVRESVPKRA